MKNITLNLFIKCVLTLLLAYCWSHQAIPPIINASSVNNIVLSWKLLPIYGLQSFIRIVLSLALSSVLAVNAAYYIVSSKNSNFWLNLLNIVQSLPNTAFLSLICFAFTRINFTMGAQLSVIATVMTCQLWNMIFDCYYLIHNFNPKYKEIIQSYKITRTTSFWDIELPQIIRVLAWSSVSSLSASWFMVVIAEHLIVRYPHGSTLSFFAPGLGGCIYYATKQGYVIHILGCLLMTTLSILVYSRLVNSFVKDYQPQKNFIQLTRNFVQSTRLKKISHISKGLLEYLLLVMGLWIIFTNVFLGHNMHDVLNVNWMLCIQKSIFTSLRVIISLLLVIIAIVPCYLVNFPQQPHYLKYLATIGALPISGLYGLVVMVFSKLLSMKSICVILMSMSSLPYLVNSCNYGFDSLNKDFLSTLKYLKLSKSTSIRKVSLPYYLPHIFTGLVSTLGAIWNSIVLCEFISWNEQDFIVKGIGEHMLNIENNINNLELMFCIFLMSIASYLVFALLNFIKKLLLKNYYL